MRRLSARELHRHLPPRLDRNRVVEHGLDLFPAQFVHEPDLIGVHEARVAHHVAAVRQIDRQHRAAPVCHRARTVVMQFLVVVRADVAAGENLFEMREKLGVDRHHVFEVAVDRAILHHQNLAVALNNLGFDLTRFFVAQNLHRQLAVDDLVADFGDALRTQ